MGVKYTRGLTEKNTYTHTQQTQKAPNMRYLHEDLWFLPAFAKLRKVTIRHVRLSARALDGF